MIIRVHGGILKMPQFAAALLAAHPDVASRDHGNACRVNLMELDLLIPIRQEAVLSIHVESFRAHRW